MSNRPIHYEPHPVSRERKSEIIAAGFRIVDAKFKPKGTPVEAVEDERPADSDPGEQIDDGQTLDPVADTLPEPEPAPGMSEEPMSADELKAALTARGVKFRANASRATLEALLSKED
jgi:hypothetical protein